MSQKWWLPPPVCVCAESLSQELWRAFPRWRRRLTDGSDRKSPPCEERLSNILWPARGGRGGSWTKALHPTLTAIISTHSFCRCKSLKKKKKQKRKAPDSRKGGVTTVRLCKENKTTTTKTFFETLLRVFRRKQTLPQDWTETWTTALWFIFILFFCFCCFSPFCIFLSKDNYHFREGTSPGCVFV